MESDRIMRQRTPLFFAATLAGALTLSACSSAGTGGTATVDTGTPDTTANTGAYPLTVDNCGTEVTFEQAPERVITYFQHPTEILIALGLEDRVIGHVWPDNDPLPGQAEAYNSLNLIAEQGTSFEQLIAMEPDLIFGGYASAFSAEQGRSRESFADAGINTYLTWESCVNAETQIDDLYDELRELGTIFGVGEEADRIAGELEAQVTETTERYADSPEVDVFVYDSGEQAPMTVGGSGIGNQVIELAGGNNIFADVTGNFADVSWEQVLTRSPEAVIILDYASSTPPEEKIEYLRSRPEITTDRFLVLTLQDTVLGVRAPQAVPVVAEFLHP